MARWRQARGPRDAPAPAPPPWAIPAPARPCVPDELPAARRHCRDCDVQWTGPAPCWYCGQPATTAVARDPLPGRVT